MAFDPGALGAASLVRRRLQRIAIGIEHAMADLAPAMEQEHALAAALALARADLRRACSLGHDHGGAARQAALALLALVCARTLAAAPTRQQLMAALAMHEGYAAELGFGAGKPLAVALTAILHVWSGRSCHVVGASDYLAARDAAALDPLYRICGCSAAALAGTTAPAQVAQCYGADVLYATGRQLLSDFMRDHLLLGGAVSPLRRSLRAQHMALDAPQPVTRGTGVAIIDDIEAVLVDEAASPVLISAAGNYSVLDEATQAARVVADELQLERDFRIARHPLLQVHFTPEGERKLAYLVLRLPVYWQHPKRASDLMSLALLARDGLEIDRHYVVREGRVMIVDDSVYRLLAGRAWHFGMLQAVEARQGLPCSVPPRTIARAAFQSFFPRYHSLAGAGSAFDALAPELLRIYGLPIARLAPVAPPALVRLFDDRRAKLDAFIDMIAQLHAQRLPVLVGAPRSADMADIGRMLAERGIAFAVADGRDPAADAQLLSCAAQPGPGMPAGADHARSDGGPDRRSHGGDDASTYVGLDTRSPGLDAPSEFGLDTSVGLDAPSEFGLDTSVGLDAPSEFGLDTSSDVGRVTLLLGAAGRGACIEPGAALHALLFEHWDARRADLAFCAHGASAIVFTALDDDLLVRNLPAWAAWLRRLARVPALRRGAFRLMVALAQRQVARQGSRHRQAMVLREVQLDQQLAFSKKG
jgi:preprotein translocase subunit SecA